MTKSLLFQSMLDEWRVRANKMVQAPLFRQNSLEEATLSTGVTTDATSSHSEDGSCAAPHNDCAGNTTEQHAKLSLHDLEMEFKRRHRALLRGCADYDAREVNSRRNWRAPMRIRFPGPLTMYTAFKVCLWFL